VRALFANEISERAISIARAFGQKFAVAGHTAPPEMEPFENDNMAIQAIDRMIPYDNYRQGRQVFRQHIPLVTKDLGLTRTKRFVDDEAPVIGRMTKMDTSVSRM
jgi:hypothetical protein